MPITLVTYGAILSPHSANCSHAGALETSMPMNTLGTYNQCPQCMLVYQTSNKYLERSKYLELGIYQDLTASGQALGWWQCRGGRGSALQLILTPADVAVKRKRGI